jgi:hypothetical protein
MAASMMTDHLRLTQTRSAQRGRRGGGPHSQVRPVSAESDAGIVPPMALYDSALRHICVHGYPIGTLCAIIGTPGAIIGARRGPARTLALHRRCFRSDGTKAPVHRAWIDGRSKHANRIARVGHDRCSAGCVVAGRTGPRGPSAPTATRASCRRWNCTTTACSTPRARAARTQRSAAGASAAMVLRRNVHTAVDRWQPGCRLQMLV